MLNPDESNILRLNDDCFYHILKLLPVIEWCSLRETCTRLRLISDYCFKRQTERFRLTSYNLSVKDVKRLLRNFGQFIEKLSIDQNYFSGSEDCGELMPYIERYCLSLFDLKFVNFNANLTRVVHRTQLFVNLQRLVVDQWSDDQAFACCLADCASLKELVLSRLTNIPGDSVAYRQIETLESFTMNCCEDFNYDTLKRFLSKNSQLTRVKFFNLKFRNEVDADHLMQFVAETLLSLEALSVLFNIVFRPNVLPVTRLISLKRFEINMLYVADDIANQLLTDLSLRHNIEELNLSLFKCSNKSLQCLLLLKSLKILKFTETNELDGNMCDKLATELPVLSEIHFVECNGISFVEIKQFILHLPQLKRIVFNRVNDMLPSLTHVMFLDLVELRGMHSTTDVLKIFLNDDDVSDINLEFKLNGFSKTLALHSHVVRILPLEKEHRRTVFEYGSRFMRRSNNYQ